MALDPVTETQQLIKRDFEVVSANQNRLNPTDADAVVAGEFVAQSTTEPTKVVIGSPLTGTATHLAAAFSAVNNRTLVRQVFTEQGDFSSQSSRKLTTLWSFPYEALTNVFDATAEIFIGDPLTVDDGTQTAVDNRLVLQKAIAGSLVYGYALSSVAAAATPLATVQLRFVFTGPTFFLQ